MFRFFRLAVKSLVWNRAPNHLNKVCYAYLSREGRLHFSGAEF